MRYLGSKTSVLSEIKKIIDEYDEKYVFCDPFGGIGTVGSYMKKLGYKVITGDILTFAHFFQIALIENTKTNVLDNVKNIIGVETDEQVEDFFNCLELRCGWLVEEYAIKRKFFTVENAMRIQACIDCIWEWNRKDELKKYEYEILIASLIQSIDKVANTAGTYYAYLKDYYRKAKQSFRFELISIIQSEKQCQSYLMDANDLVKVCKYDILYLDPPYNERKYERYYHLPETIAKGVVPKPVGKSGVFVHDSLESAYNRKREAVGAFTELINSANAKCIIFHYTDNGLIDIKEARKILQQKGNLQEYYFDCKGYNTSIIPQKCKHHIFKVVI